MTLRSSNGRRMYAIDGAPWIGPYCVNRNVAFGQRHLWVNLRDSQGNSPRRVKVGSVVLLEDGRHDRFVAAGQGRTLANQLCPGHEYTLVTTLQLYGDGTQQWALTDIGLCRLCLHVSTGHGEKLTDAA